jgi:signal transduction histidine kinase
LFSNAQQYAKAKRSKLLKPFTRGENSEEKPGYGMGLAIVSRIAQLHHATHTITDSAELGGAEFCLTFNL